MPLESSYVPQVKNIEFKIGTLKVRVGAISNESYFYNPNSSGKNISPYCISQLLPNGCKYRCIWIQSGAIFLGRKNLEGGIIAITAAIYSKI